MIPTLPAFPDLTIPRNLGWSDRVKQWCLGANNRVGTCSFVDFANFHALVTTTNGTPEIMPDGEILNADRTLTGYNSQDPTTDHGIALETMLEDMLRDGWPGDPSLRPRGVWSVPAALGLSDAIYLFGGVICWFMLPQRDDDWDFSQGAVDLGLPGIGPHAMFVGRRSHVVTWAEEREVTQPWFDRYFRGAFGVYHPAWVHPDGVDVAALLGLPPLVA